MVPAKRQNIANQTADDSILAAQFKNTQHILLSLSLIKQHKFITGGYT